MLNLFRVVGHTKLYRTFISMEDDVHSGLLDTETLKSLHEDPTKDLPLTLSSKDTNGRNVLQTLAKLNTEGLKYVSEVIPGDEFVRLTLEPENFGMNSADRACAIGNSGSLAIILDIFMKEGQLDKLWSNRDSSKKNIIHQSTLSGLPDCFKLITKYADRSVVEQLIAEKDDQFSDVLAVASSNKRDCSVLAAISNYLGKEKIGKLIGELDRLNRNALHRAGRSDNFLQVLKMITKKQAIELICVRDDLQRNVFHHNATHRDARGLQESIKLVGKEKSIELIEQTNTENENVVTQCAANNWTVEPLEACFEVLGKKRFLEMLFVKDSSQEMNSGHNSVVNYAPNNLQFIVDKLDNKSLLKLLKTVDKTGKSMLDMACGNVERLRIIGDSLEKETFIQMMTEEDIQGQTVIHKYGLSEPGSITYLFNLFDVNQIKHFVSKKNENGETLLHVAAREECDETIKTVHTFVDDDVFLEIIQSLNNEGRNVLQEACLSDEMDALNAIIDSIDLNQVAQLASNKDTLGQNAFHICAQSRLSEGILTLFEMFFDGYDKARALISDKDEIRNTVAHYAAKSDVCLGAILEVIHEEDRGALFNTRNGQDYTVIQMAGMHANSYTDEIKVYSMQQDNVTTHASNMLAQNSMHEFIELHANDDEQTFNKRVVSFNFEQWKQLTTSDALGHTPFHVAAKNASPENMDTLLFNVKYQTKLKWAVSDFLFGKDKKSETPITIARFNARASEMWRIFEKHLPDKKTQLDNEIKRAEQKMKKETRKWLPDVQITKFGSKP